MTTLPPRLFTKLEAFVLIKYSIFRSSKLQDFCAKKRNLLQAVVS